MLSEKKGRKLSLGWYPFFPYNWKWKWRDTWYTAKMCSAFNPSKVLTHSSEHTHTQSSGQPFMLQQLRVQYLAQVVVLKVERALDIHSPHRQFLPARDSNSQPVDYESDSLTIRPRLPNRQWHYLPYGIKCYGTQCLPVVCLPAFV